MEQVTFTDWDQECELLKEWLKQRVNNYADNLIIQSRVIEAYTKSGILFIPDYYTQKRIPLSFEQWKWATKAIKDFELKYFNN